MFRQLVYVQSQKLLVVTFYVGEVFDGCAEQIEIEGSGINEAKNFSIIESDHCSYVYRYDQI